MADASDFFGHAQDADAWETKSPSLTHRTSSRSSNGHVGSAVIIRLTVSCDENWPLRHHLWTLLKVQGGADQHNMAERALRPAVNCGKLRFGT